MLLPLQLVMNDVRRPRRRELRIHEITPAHFYRRRGSRVRAGPGVRHGREPDGFALGPPNGAQHGSDVGDAVGLLVAEFATALQAREGLAVVVGAQGVVPRELVEAAVLAEFLERGEPDGLAVGAGGEGDQGEGLPEIFAEGSGDGFLAVVGQLAEGGIVLWGVGLVRY